PEEVNILPVPNYYKYVAKTRSTYSYIEHVRYNLTRIKTSLNLRVNRYKGKVNNEQILYKSHKSILPRLSKEYDVAIGYAQGMPTYYIIDKVMAKKKISWINCDYANTKYDKNFDKQYYEKLNHIVVVSNTIESSVIKLWPEYREKINMVLDIIDPKLITQMANMKIDVYPNKNQINILTVGRLVIHHKGYDLAVKGAKILKDKGINFKWFVLGEGEDRKNIESLITQLGLQNEFILLGEDDNPYPYMKECDLYVQPSRKEGFGLTVMEAKILRKPIVCTNFNTASELLKDEIDGVIVEQSPEGISLGIQQYLDNEFKNKIINTLKSKESYTSIGEIEKICNLVG
ncbi:MAG: glycosyltransferase, partial [Peptostreptococcaceae bacterium]